MKSIVRFKKLFLSTCMGILFLPLSAHAVLINTSIGDYEVTTVLTRFDDAESLLKSQVWWENVPLAEEFARLTNTAFGTPNLGIYSPFFWQTDRDSTGPCSGIGEPYAGVFWDHRSGRASPVCAASAPGGPFTFAIAEAVPVPEPAGWAMLILGAAGLGFARFRRR